MVRKRFFTDIVSPIQDDTFDAVSDTPPFSIMEITEKEAKEIGDKNFSTNESLGHLTDSANQKLYYDVRMLKKYKKGTSSRDVLLSEINKKRQAISDEPLTKEQKELVESAPLEVEADEDYPTYLNTNIYQNEKYDAVFKGKDYDPKKTRSENIWNAVRNSYIDPRGMRFTDKEYEKGRDETGKSIIKPVLSVHFPSGKKYLKMGLDPDRWKQINQNIKKMTGDVDIFGYTIGAFMEADMKEQFLNGIIRTGKGFATALTDVGSYYGYKRAKNISAWMQLNIPEIPPNTGLEELTMYAVQYGIPSAVTFKVVNAALMGSAPALQILGHMTSQMGSDFLATTQDVQTLGDVFKFGYTQTKGPDEENLLRRFKISGETVPSGLAMQTLLGGLKLGGRALKRVFWDPFQSYGNRNLRKGEEIAADFMQTEAVDPDAAIKRIDEWAIQNRNREKAGEIEVSPSFRTGEVTQDIGLMRMQKKIEELPVIGSKIKSELDEFRKELADVFNKQLGGGKYIEPEDMGPTTEFFKEQDKIRKLAIEKANKEVEMVIQDSVEAYKQYLQNLGIGREAMDTVFDEGVFARLVEIQKQKATKYANIDPQNKVPIDKGLFNEWVNTYFNPPQKFTLDDPTRTIINAFDLNLGQGQGQTVFDEIASGRGYTFGALQGMKKTISDAIYTIGNNPAFKNLSNAGQAMDRLKHFNYMLEKQTDILSKSKNPLHKEAADNAIEAKRWWKEEYKEVFGEGTGKDYKKLRFGGDKRDNLHKRTKRLLGLDIETENFSGIDLAAKQIRKIVDLPYTPNVEDYSKSVIENALENKIIGDVAELLMKKDGKVNMALFNAYRSKVKPLIERFPALGKKFDDMGIELNRFKGNIEGKNETTIKLKEEAGRLQKEWEVSQAKAVFGSDIFKIARSALNSDNPLKETKRLFKESLKDKTGQTTQSLKRVFLKEFNNRLKSKTDPIQFNGEEFFEGVRGQITELLNDDSLRHAWEFVVGNGNKTKGIQQRKLLEAYRSKLEKISSVFKVQGKSNLEEMMKGNKMWQEMRVFLASVYGIVRGQGVYFISRVATEKVSEKMGLMNITPDMVGRRILMDAISDPELTKRLLTLDVAGRNSSRTARRWISAYIGNNIIPSIVNDSRKEGATVTPLEPLGEDATSLSDWWKKMGEKKDPKTKPKKYISPKVPLLRKGIGGIERGGLVRPRMFGM